MSIANAAAVARRVDRQRIPAVMREVSRLQCPHAVIVARAVDEDDARVRRVDVAPAGVGVDRASVDVDLHYRIFDVAYKARLRSSIKSSAFSRPTDSRIVPSVMPAAASFAAETRKCVVLAGWITSHLASPTLARCEKILSDSMNFR